MELSDRKYLLQSWPGLGLVFQLSDRPDFGASQTQTHSPQHWQVFCFKCIYCWHYVGCWINCHVTEMDACTCCGWTGASLPGQKLQFIVSDQAGDSKEIWLHGCCRVCPGTGSPDWCCFTCSGPCNMTSPIRAWINLEDKCNSGRHLLVAKRGTLEDGQNQQHELLDCSRDYYIVPSGQIWMLIMLTLLV